MFKYLLLITFCSTAAAQNDNPAPADPNTVSATGNDKDQDIFFKIGGGARLRQYIIKDSTAGALPFEEDYLQTSHRAQLDLRLNKGEYFESYFRLIHQGVWGEEATTQDVLTVQLAWGDWKVTDFLNLRFGRQSIEIGRGLVYGANEWENLPTFYDGFSFLFDWNVMELSLYALKIHELDRVGGASIASDPEVSHYLLDLDFKELSDYIKMADIYFVQILGDVGQIPSSTTLLKKQRVQRFGFDFIASGVYFEAGSSLNYITGSKEDITTDDKVKQVMLDGEVKFMMPSWDQFSFWVGAHYDSGDDDATDGSDSQYDPLYYNLHYNAGRMDFFKFGNLTFARTGMSFQLLSDWYFGAEYFLFQKSKENAPNFIERGPLAAAMASNQFAFAADKDLGFELDLWVGKTWPSGMKAELGFNYLEPGKALEGATVVASGAPALMDKGIYNIIFDMGFFF